MIQNKIDESLTNILGQSNMIKNNKVNNNKNYLYTRDYVIELKCLKVYTDTISDEILKLIDEHEITKLELIKKINHPIDNLPNIITELVLHNAETSQLYDLPNSITNLYLVNFVGQLDCLCSTVKTIDFGSKFNSDVKNLPEKLEELKFGDAFNKSVDFLPECLKIIIFGESFNQNVNNLPNKLERIFFGKNFSQPIDKLPDSVVYISFNWIGKFNQPIFKLPEKLEELYFNNEFNNYICDLPSGLKKITLGSKFNKPIYINKRLEKIKLSRKYKYMNILNLSLSGCAIKETY